MCRWPGPDHRITPGRAEEIEERGGAAPLCDGQKDCHGPAEEGIDFAREYELAKGMAGGKG